MRRKSISEWKQQSRATNQSVRDPRRRRILENSPTAIACLKAALNADEDGQAGIQTLAGHATRLFYLSEEGKEGRDAFLEKRPARCRVVFVEQTTMASQLTPHHTQFPPTRRFRELPTSKL